MRCASYSRGGYLFAVLCDGVERHTEGSGVTEREALDNLLAKVNQFHADALAAIDEEQARLAKGEGEHDGD